MKRGRHLLGSETGAMAAEFAIVLPVLLLFVMGILEGGRVVDTWMVLTNESREAARYGVMGIRDGDANLSGEVASFATAHIGQMLDPSGLTVSVSVQLDGSSPAAVTVDTTYQVAMVTPMMQAILGTVPVTVQSVMRAE